MQIKTSMETSCLINWRNTIFFLMIKILLIEDDDRNFDRSSYLGKRVC